LEVAVQRMSTGQLVEVTIPHLYAYGQRGHLPEIPPRSTLIFRLELVEIIVKRGRKK
jgi:FKBP-type peptidyl-prolyl cis-trans isomerase